MPIQMRPTFCARPGFDGGVRACVRSCVRAQAERINLLKQAVEKYGNGKRDEDLTPCVVVGGGGGEKRKCDS